MKIYNIDDMFLLTPIEFTPTIYMFQMQEYIKMVDDVIIEYRKVIQSLNLDTEGPGEMQFIKPSEKYNGLLAKLSSDSVTNGIQSLVDLAVRLLFNHVLCIHCRSIVLADVWSVN